MSISTTGPKLNFAKPKQRIIAFVFDFLLIAGYILILLIIGISLTAFPGITSLLNSPLATNILSFMVLVLPVILYFALQEYSTKQATWGKRRAKIKVVTKNGSRMSFSQSLLRSAVKFFPWQLAHICIIALWYGNQSTIYLVGAITAQAFVVVYFVSLWFNKKHQTMYDWVAGNYVIRKDEN
ncbi:MAG: RDD family protein [Anaerolineaceae bacterium]|nr:RDD family protein [Anaerolineaceae bacterium]